MWLALTRLTRTATDLPSVLDATTVCRLLTEPAAYRHFGTHTKCSAPERRDDGQGSNGRISRRTLTAVQIGIGRSVIWSKAQHGDLSSCCNVLMRADRLKSLNTVMEETNGRLNVDEDAGAKVWPSGFTALDVALAGGFRSGELALLGGAPGLGKTTFALQVARNLIASDYSVVYFSFEHDNHSLLERLIVLEAADIAGIGALRLPAVREAFNGSHSVDRMMAGRLAGTEGGEQAVQTLQGYSSRLHLHRSSGAETNVEAMREVIESIREHTGQRVFVIVDYLQKVQAAAPSAEVDRKS